MSKVETPLGGARSADEAGTDKTKLLGGKLMYNEGCSSPDTSTGRIYTCEELDCSIHGKRNYDWTKEMTESRKQDKIRELKSELAWYEDQLELKQDLDDHSGLIRKYISNYQDIEQELDDLDKGGPMTIEELEEELEDLPPEERAEALDALEELIRQMRKEDQ